MHASDAARLRVGIVVVALTIVCVICGFAARGRTGTLRFLSRTGLHRRGVRNRFSPDRAVRSAADAESWSSDDEPPACTLSDDQDEDSWQFLMRIVPVASILPSPPPTAVAFPSLIRSALFLAPSTPLLC